MTRGRFKRWQDAIGFLRNRLFAQEINVSLIYLSPSPSSIGGVNLRFIVKPMRPIWQEGNLANLPNPRLKKNELVD